MGSLFNLILVVIFVYLVYQLLIKQRINKNNPTSKNDSVHDPKPEDEKSIQKKIDLSDVEDADYKEIK